MAIFDLLESNRFCPLPRSGRERPTGPFNLTISMRTGQLVVATTKSDGASTGAFHLSMTPFRQAIKDYVQICDSYVQAVKTLPLNRIEAIDMGRRAIHDEGAKLLMERLADKVETDFPTARRLFTLLCALEPRH